MVEEFSRILTNGFDTWRKNLVICLPFVFSLILTSVAAIMILGGALTVALGPLMPSLEQHLTNSGEIPPEIIQQLQLQLLQNPGIIIAAIVVTTIAVLLINSFFIAGAIGMAKEATAKGMTGLSEMMYYSRRKFMSLLFANIIVGLITFAGAVFLIPGILELLPVITTAKTPLDVMATSALPLLSLGVMTMILYMLVVSIILAVPPYAVVIDDLGAVEGVKKGFGFFMAHKLDVALIWLILLVIALFSGITLGSIPYIGQWLSMAVSVIVIQPLTAIWWSRLYLSGIEQPTEF